MLFAHCLQHRYIPSYDRLVGYYAIHPSLQKRLLSQVLPQNL